MAGAFDALQIAREMTESVRSGLIPAQTTIFEAEADTTPLASGAAASSLPVPPAAASTSAGRVAEGGKGKRHRTRQREGKTRAERAVEAAKAMGMVTSSPTAAPGWITLNVSLPRDCYDWLTEQARQAPYEPTLAKFVQWRLREWHRQQKEREKLLEEAWAADMTAQQSAREKSQAEQEKALAEYNDEQGKFYSDGKALGKF